MSVPAALAVARKYANGGAVGNNLSAAQKEAGNYKKKHIVFQGIQISIENPKGTIRSGIDHKGKPWSARMTEDYGYIKRTVGHDGDQVDCFVGPNKRSNRVWVVDQLHHSAQRFDEHKCLLGFNTEKQAISAYRGSYGRIYDIDHAMGAVTEMSVDAFKEWLKGGGGKNPISPDVPQYQDGGVVFDPDYLGKTKPDKTPNVRVTEGHQEFEKGYVASGRSPWNTDYPYRPILNTRGQELHALKIKTGGAVKEANKITRDAFLYMDPKPPKDTFAQCGTCVMFTGTGCTIMGKTKITKDMTCALYIHGKPSFDLKGKEFDLVTPREAGLYQGQVRCENCRYGGEHCQLYEMLNEKAPEAFNLDTKIDSKGCCNAFTGGGIRKYQEGGAVDDSPVEDVPGVGPMPTTTPDIPEPAAIKAYREMPSWADQAAQEAQRSAEAYQRAGVKGMFADTGAAQELAGGFGGTTIGKIGGITKTAEEAVHHWSQSIADALITKHGSNIGAIESALDNLFRTNNTQASTAVLAKLPEDVQHELIMRELQRSSGGFGRTEQVGASGATPEAPPSPAFREITHPEEAKDWLREHGHSPEDWGYSDPENYVDLANDLKRRELGLVQPARNLPPPPVSLETRGTVSRDTLNELFQLISPSEIEHLSPEALIAVRNTLSKIKNPYDYETKNPEIWNALHAKFDAMDRAMDQRMAWAPTRATPSVEATAPVREPPGPFQRVTGGFSSYFNNFIAPLTKWFYPANEATPETFAKKFFAGLDTSHIGADVWQHYRGTELQLSGELYDKEGNYVARIRRQINPEGGYAHHDYLKLADRYQGTDIGPTLLRNSVDLYKEMGLKRVEVYAALESGPYAWAKYGFIPTQSSWDSVRGILKRQIDTNRFKISDPGTRADVMDILNSNDPRSIWNLVDYKGVDDLGNPIGPTAMLGYEAKGAKEIIFGNNPWDGNLHLNDEASMRRLDDYIKSRLRKKAPP